MEFSKPSVKALRERLEGSMFGNSVIKPILLELGVNASLGNAKFDDDRVTFQLIIENKDALREIERDLPDMAKLYGLDTTKIGKHKGKSFSLVGWKRRARKEPWVIQDLQTGTEYIIGLSHATHLFGTEKSKEEFKKTVREARASKEQMEAMFGKAEK